MIIKLVNETQHGLDNIPDYEPKYTVPNILCQASFNNIFNKTPEFKKFMFPKYNTDCCTIC